MLRRILLPALMLLVLVVSGCTSRTASDESTDADERAEPAETKTSEQEFVPARLDAREVAAVEGVRTFTELEEGDALVGTWSSCELQGELADLGDGRRSPIRRLLANDNHVYVVYGNDNNDTWIRAFSVDVDEDACVAKPWKEFGDNGQLDVGSGVADTTLFDDTLITTGIETTRYSLTGEKLGTCDALARFTRLRGRAGHARGVARKSGLQLFDVAIEGEACTVTPLDELEGEEVIGMQIAPLDDNSSYAILQAERAPNAFAYLKDGAIAWRYFPGDGDQDERISLISQLITLADDAVVLRSLQKKMDVIDRDGARRAKVKLSDFEAIDTLTFPDNIVALDDQRVLVALRHHKSGVELEGLSLGLLTFRAADDD